MTTTLTAWIEDETLYDHYFELFLYSTTLEEPEWYNITQVRINYEKPPCEVT